MLQRDVHGHAGWYFTSEICTASVKRESLENWGTPSSIDKVTHNVQHRENHRVIVVVTEVGRPTAGAHRSMATDNPS